ncbi:MAG: hypothetical protein ABR552_02155, partial [Actinomycetota bacterium]
NITFDKLKHIPLLSDTKLLSLEILGSHADIGKTSSGLFQALGKASVADVKVLDDAANGPFVSIGSVAVNSNSTIDLNPPSVSLNNTSASSILNKTAKDAVSKLNLVRTPGDLQLTGVQLGGLVSALKFEDNLIDSAGYQKLRDGIKGTVDSVQPGLADEILSPFDIAYYTAGIDMKKHDGSVFTKDGKYNAESNNFTQRVGTQTLTTNNAKVSGSDFGGGAISPYLTLTVAPQIPNLAVLKRLNTDGHVLPPIDPASDFQPTGLKLNVGFPKATTEVAQGAVVLGIKFQKTGIGISWLAVMMLMGAAVGVKKFALGGK